MNGSAPVQEDPKDVCPKECTNRALGEKLWNYLLKKIELMTEAERVETHLHLVKCKPCREVLKERSLKRFEEFKKQEQEEKDAQQ